MICDELHKKYVDQLMLFDKENELIRFESLKTMHENEVLKKANVKINKIVVRSRKVGNIKTTGGVIATLIICLKFL